MWSERDTTNRIIKYYSYLFSFPSYRTLIVVVAIMPAMACTLSSYLQRGADGFIIGLELGFLGITVPIMFVDLLTLLLLREDEYMSPRRVAILSYSSVLVLVAFIISSSVIASLTGFEWITDRSLMFAIGLNGFLRNLAITVLSTRNVVTKLVVIFAQPASLFSSTYIMFPSYRTLLIPGVLGLVIMVAGSGLILWTMGRWEDEHHRIKLLPLFRSFILAWADKVSGPLEEQIARMGELRDLQVDSMIFRDAEGSCKAGLIIPYIHPGPFRDVGSSSMPKVLSEGLGNRLGGEVLVAHGISTHELDLTKSSEIDRIFDLVYSGLPLGEVSQTSTGVIIVEREGAKVSCQMFGRIAFLTMTLSPKSYDDLPEELRQRIWDKAGEMGLTAMIVDSHNSIQRDDELQSIDVENLYEAAISAMKKAEGVNQGKFSVGASRIIPDEWKLEDGMGPCGVATLLVKPEEGDEFAYVVLDGNNIISGARESILSEVKTRTSIEAELLTSDTHLVNAIGATTRGYYPLGERTERRRLAEYVSMTIEEANSKLAECTASYSRVMVPGLMVLGEKGLSLISEVLESAFSLFKRSAIVSIASSLILAVGVVFFL